MGFWILVPWFGGFVPVPPPVKYGVWSTEYGEVQSRHCTRPPYFVLAWNVCQFTNRDSKVQKGPGSGYSQMATAVASDTHTHIAPDSKPPPCTVKINFTKYLRNLDLLDFELQPLFHPASIDSYLELNRRAFSH